MKLYLVLTNTHDEHSSYKILHIFKEKYEVSLFMKDSHSVNFDIVEVEVKDVWEDVANSYGGLQ